MKSVFAMTSVVALLLPSSGALAQTPQAETRAENAALQYWQAFALMPALTPDQERLLEEWDRVALDGQARELLTASSECLKYLRRGAKLEHCDWGLDYNDGISLLLPHLAKARTLSRLAALDARRHFEMGNTQEAGQISIALMTLARHVGSDPILICILVRCSIEDVVSRLVAPYLPKQNLSYEAATAAFQSLPAGATIADAMLTEKKFMAEWLIAKLKETENQRQGSWRELWNNLVETPEVSDAIKQVASVEEAIGLIEDLIPVYDELKRVVSLPPNEFDREYPRFLEKAKAASPAAEILLPSMEKMLATQRRSQVRLAMLLAAIAVIEHGPSKLQEIPDPFGSEPFQYRALDEGFELKSMLQYEGQPVTILIGRRASE